MSDRLLFRGYERSLVWFTRASQGNLFGQLTLRRQLEKFAGRVTPIRTTKSRQLLRERMGAGASRSIGV